MKKSELTEMFNKWLATIPDDETESTGENGSTESVESTEKVLTTETIERTESVTENGEYKSEEKRIYVTDSGDYVYR